jgi:uncharacterized protein YeaO (DUF488 family)
MPNTTETNQNANSAAVEKGEPPRIEIRDHISREDVRAEKEKVFLFGDNLTGRGFGGQAKEMRGEENVVGIPTKKFPNNNPSAFFSDRELAANVKAIDKAFDRIPPGKTIVIPKAGLGTGLAGLQEKAPETFVYLNEKLAKIGFNNPIKKQTGIQKMVEPSVDKEINKTLKSSDTNKVFIQTNPENLRGSKRLLDLDNINTPSLKTFSPTEKEIANLKINRENALAEYSDRLRSAYKENTENFRDGLKLLGDSLEKGEQITVVCSCRNGAMCHADVVKMAVEKVNAHIKEGQTSEKNRNDKTEVQMFVQKNKQEQILNPRTQRAINEIFSFSENDKVLEKINETDGRNRSEQASYLGRVSQLVRDIYERGGSVVDGNLIVPHEKLSVSQPLAITTQNYAVEKLGKILQDETKAKEIAPIVVEYGNKIAGITADGETKLKVFGWIYDSLEGKGESLARDENNSVGERSKFDKTLREVSQLAEEMHSLEPLDKLEFVPLAGYEQNETQEAVFDNTGENLNLDEIYEEAISFQEGEKAQSVYEQNVSDQAEIGEPDGKISTESYERIELGADIPQIPDDYTKTEIRKLITETLPEIDRQLENGVTPKEILLPYNQAVWQSAGENALNRLESIYQKQKINGKEPQQSSTKAIDNNKYLHQQLAKIDLRRQNIIELKNPGDYLPAEKEATNTFYRRQKQEVGNLLTKIDEVRDKQFATNDKTEEQTLKKELNQIKEAKPNFAFKLENSAEIVVGKPSEQSVNDRNFISSYVNYQLKQPETRLRFENERYRDYAGRLESAASRDEVMKTASEIRTENASIGMSWKDLPKSEKEKLPRPLSQKELQFLFTESSPAHYTNEMTAARLSFAHSGASRRAMTESLLKSEITPSPEAQKLIKTLESRLNRPNINNSLLATKHFFESVKTPNEQLKYKNSFDHRAHYQKLPPQEKDFVYIRATQQKENLEYQLAFKKEQSERGEKISRYEIQNPEISKMEKGFHLFSQYYQARILGSKIEVPALTQKEITERDVNAIAVLLKNQRPEKLEATGKELQKSENFENKKVGEVLQTFARAEISKNDYSTTVSIKLPENGLVNTETYRELLEKFYSDTQRENAKFKFENFSEKEISRALRFGQDEAVNNFRDDIKANVYQKDASPGVLETETSVLEKIDEIKQFQTKARAAWRENQQILDKYASRANAKMQAQKIAVPTPTRQKEIVELGLGKKSVNLSPNKEIDRFLRAVQKEITISDFQKFKANEKFLDEAKFNIRQEFAGISQDLDVLNESKLKIRKTNEAIAKEKNISPISAAAEIGENKPLSLRVFEKELEKTEKHLLGASWKEKLSGETSLENEKNLDPKTFFSAEERASIKMKAFELTKENLEPKELNAVNQKLSPQASRQAFATYKQLERASNLFQKSDDKSQITEAFFKLDHEATKLNEIRQNYNRNEKIAILRDGIKTDLIDWIKKNPDLKQTNFEGQINKILMNNLIKADFVRIGDDGKQISVLSRQIAEKIEGKQLTVFSAGKTHEIPKNIRTPNSLINEGKITASQSAEKAVNTPFLNR